MKAPLLELWISGKPVPFATSLEKEWKAIMEASIPEAKPNSTLKERGILLYFHLKSEENRGKFFDLDNLVEPVLSLLVNRKKYFQGARKNILWWYARKVIDEREGLKLAIVSGDPPSFGRDRKLIYHGFCDYTFRSGEYHDLMNLLKTKVHQPIAMTNETRIALYLRFPDRINLGDISCGAVKRVIDSLYPLIGGRRSAPADWKIEELLVEKISSQLLEIKICL